MILGHFVLSEPDFEQATECPDCGFDAVLRFPLHLISSDGVMEFGTYSTCGRCWAIEHPDEGEDD